MSKASAEHLAFRPGNGWLAGIVLAVLTYWLFAQTLLNVIPGISKSLGLQSTIATLAVSITALFGGIFIVVAGGIADRWGRVRIFRIGLVLSMLGSLLVVLAPARMGGLTTTLILGGRIVQGFSYACIMPTALALIKAFNDGADRQRAVSFFSIGTFGGSGLTAFFGGALAATFLGWRSIFVLSIVVALVALFLTRKTPESRAVVAPNAPARAFDWGGLVTFFITLVALDVFIAEGAQLGWLSLPSLVLLLVTVVGAVAFFRVEAKRIGRSPFIDLSMFRNLRFTGPVLANFLINTGVAAIMVTLGLMQKGGGWNSFEAGLLTLGYVVAILSMIRVGEKLLQRFGTKKPMWWGTSILLVGIVLNSLTFLPKNLYVVAVVIGFTLFGVGLGLFATPATDAAISSVPESEVGVASGIFKMGSSLGGSIGVTIAATLVAVGAAVPASVVERWGIFSGWTVAAGPVRFGSMLGLGFVVLAAILVLVAIALTVPNADQEKVAQEKATAR
ncbi:MFS transporter, DHA2 family, multidrug resistance protein [Raineyella antarctica]|uniref:MFS transporter, DHA2 family, multidrug resistance protein n=1 Tax=Raineyella antarctica TaxID=1577474 RepID=A0A1G6HMI9_9ACTN|nr:MFS transporter [Raineyella antarctica]SDB95470.1 MFS transporter, DHA2 family, multidrug resistance protein [Raineyella antarctica]